MLIEVSSMISVHLCIILEKEIYSVLTSINLIPICIESDYYTLQIEIIDYIKKNMILFKNYILQSFYESIEEAIIDIMNNNNSLYYRLIGSFYYSTDINDNRITNIDMAITS